MRASLETFKRLDLLSAQSFNEIGSCLSDFFQSCKSDFLILNACFQLILTRGIGIELELTSKVVGFVSGRNVGIKSRLLSVCQIQKTAKIDFALLIAAESFLRSFMELLGVCASAAGNIMVMRAVESAAGLRTAVVLNISAITAAPCGCRAGSKNENAGKRCCCQSLLGDCHLSFLLLYNAAPISVP